MRITSSFKNKLIYVFGINDEEHKGCLKIGETTLNDGQTSLEEKPNSHRLNEAARKRIEQYTQTAGISFNLFYTEQTLFVDKTGNIKSFTDDEVHQVLIRSGISRKTFESKSLEWFQTDVETVIKAIRAVKEGRDSLNQNEISVGKTPISFRPEQLDAIQKTKKQFKNGNEMLWFAKMRFGKTLSALQVIKDLDFNKTLILTHRPVVDAGWFEDFSKIFYDKPNYHYGSKNNGNSFQTLENLSKRDKSKYVYFSTIQDLRGSAQVGGNIDKNNELFKTHWDFIIVDEAHEGTQTELGKNVINELLSPTTKVLNLSGTPFNLLDNYKEEEIFTWDYVMEQRAKQNWELNHFGNPNPYASLPKLNIFTYDIGKLLKDYIDEDVAFNFREFFRVNKEGKFIHERDILFFLNMICKESEEGNFPYSTVGYRENFRHSLWMVPGVKEARALSSLLQIHPVFSQFTIINVAGDGDEEETKEDALKKVQNGITQKPHETYTITLSCGKLTTGVSVPAWTAVFMLSGSFNTSASSYMQTIFRVQTPATINGRVKEECFVFDFAPDRTLKVIAETAKISSKAGKTSTNDRQTMGDFLNFCPVISVVGSKMTPYNVEGMMEQLKKVYVDRVVSNGFEDGFLYNNDQLMKLGDIEKSDFEKLKGIIGSTKSMAKGSNIDINIQGFTNEEYDILEIAEKKNKSKKELSEEETILLKDREEKRKLRDSAISILRGISIRMPLLIYGADINEEETQINIDNFSELIDDQSWEEFMPNGVTKEIFNGFKKYYEPDVFRAAGKRIRNMTRSVDNLPIEERINRITTIFSTFRNPDKETVLTPWRVVNMHMGDCLGGYVFFNETFDKILDKPRYVSHGTVTDEVFHSDSKILEINSKSGLYPLYVSYSIYRNILKLLNFNENNPPSLEEMLEIWDKVVTENIFVICKTPMAKSITKRTLVGFRKVKVNTRYFEDLVNQISHKQQNFLDKIKQGKTYWKSNNDDNMKFNAVVGNPPYQINVGVTKENYGILIFGKFVDIAKKLNPVFVSMITPSRWFTGGRGLDDFRKEMLNEEKIRYIKDFIDSKDCFPGVDISGGISYFLWDNTYKNDCVFASVSNGETNTNLRKLNQYEIFIRYNGLLSIIDKVKNKENLFLNDFVSPQTPFGFVTTFRGENVKFPNAIELHTSGGISFVKKDDVSKNQDLIDKYKIIFSKATSEHAGTPDKNGRFRLFSSIKILKPNEICSQSYLVGNYFENIYNAERFFKYLHTQFVRILILPTLTSQDLSKEKFQFVPLQDFTENSDIDWNKSIPEIDKQLYAKYNLTEEEIGFIEKMIKPMN